MKIASLISGCNDYTHLLSIKVKLLSLSHFSCVILNFVLCVKPEKEKEKERLTSRILGIELLIKRTM